ELSKTVHTSILLSIIGGVFLTLLGLFGAEKMLGLMSTPEDIVGLASVYLRI
ncbi:MAG: MATE family efflux transporter, partial [Candidatus Flemingiibacterium sp.]